MRYTPTIQSSNIQIGGQPTLWLPQFQRFRHFPKNHRFLLSAVGASIFAGAVVFGGMRSGVLSYSSSAGASAIPSAVGVVRHDIPMQGLNIANNGLTYLQGARVASVSGSRIDVVSEWNAGIFHWAILLYSGTRFVLPNGEAGTLSDIKPGDFVAITGELSKQSSDILIEADVVRLVSPETRDTPVVYLQEVTH